MLRVGEEYMKRIEDIDKNFASQVVQYEGMKVYDVQEAPFKTYGLMQPNSGRFERMPQQIADKVNVSVQQLNSNTSGGRIRFKTDSEQIIVSAVLPTVCHFPHMPLTGTSCFDLYADGEYVNVFRPEFFDKNKDESERYDATIFFGERKMRDIMIHFPLYNEVRDVLVALKADATVLAGETYEFKKPIVFYGSSITQGGCASHPGNCYPAIISRRLNCDYINLGFSAGCFGEQTMAEYIGGLEMGALVYDYDHNAGDIALLEATHEACFCTIREKRPDVPIVIVSAADKFLGLQQEDRWNIIRRTYDNAIKNGDKNVYLVDGREIYKEVGVDLCTVDSIHPNDLGFWCMANKIGEVVKRILKHEEITE